MIFPNDYGDSCWNSLDSPRIGLSRDYKAAYVKVQQHVIGITRFYIRNCKMFQGIIGFYAGKSQDRPRIMGSTNELTRCSMDCIGFSSDLIRLSWVYWFCIGTCMICHGLYGLYQNSRSH